LRSPWQRLRASSTDETSELCNTNKLSDIRAKPASCGAALAVDRDINFSDRVKFSGARAADSPGLRRSVPLGASQRMRPGRCDRRDLALFRPRALSEPGRQPNRSRLHLG
jgi:hypothetical protein